MKVKNIASIRIIQILTPYLKKQFANIIIYVQLYYHIYLLYTSLPHMTIIIDIIICQLIVRHACANISEAYCTQCGWLPVSSTLLCVHESEGRPSAFS